MMSSRSASLEVPVFAIPRNGDLGCGDTQAVHDLLELAGELRLQCLTLLPIQETVRDNDPSSSISLYALDPILLDVSPQALVDLPPADYERLTAEFPEPGQDDGVLDYSRVKKIKLDLLWEAFGHFWENQYLQGTPRAGEYHRFCRHERAWLPDYSMYRMLMDFEEGRASWEEWSEDYNLYEDAKQFVARIAANKPEAVERQLAFYAYVQWMAEVQWQSVHLHAERLGIRLTTDVHCAISPYCSECFRAPDRFHLQTSHGQKTAICREGFLKHLESRLRRFSSIFDQFRILDFRHTLAHVNEDENLRAFVTRLPNLEREAPSMTAKVQWEGLPSLVMRAEHLWPAPNGQLTAPAADAQMSFSSFGAQSLRRLWSRDARFRSRLKNHWSVDPKIYDAKATLSLLRRLFQHPAPDVQIAYVDLAGLENNPGAPWLARYSKGPRHLMEGPDWDQFREKFRKMLRETSREAEPVEKPAEPVEKLAESV